MCWSIPVCLTWGPLHRSIKGPHLYTVVVSVFTFSFRIRTWGRGLEGEVAGGKAAGSKVWIPNLELVVFKHLQQVSFFHLQPLKWLLFLDDPLDTLIYNLEVVV